MASKYCNVLALMRNMNLSKNRLYILFRQGETQISYVRIIAVLSISSRYCCMCHIYWTSFRYLWSVGLDCSGGTHTVPHPGPVAGTGEQVVTGLLYELHAFTNLGLCDLEFGIAL